MGAFGILLENQTWPKRCGHMRVKDVTEAKELGFFSMGFVLTGLFSAAHALKSAYSHLLEHGESESLRGQRMDFPQFLDFIGVQERYDDDARYRADRDGGKRNGS